ncbi:DUF5801 repeats-in-toxin domain-containing protein [Bradyrhizobium uaiense]|uniref:DUF5801 domain-containing protein n=1 Tax=Bradyrhizobium uaiense TaxID=2594946 RepID=A0A6P1BKY1_9BRAD|nr:DUF5801 repeats-in-toxin domain-containing protein [Bradyrhizobium uaiense]NEU98869.1 hypothetical protein [Bradyrhizobium uaiense]
MQAAAGDPVCQGDVIEVAAGGRVDIRLTDGTLLNLPAGARLELGDPAQISCSGWRPGLLAKARSIVRFIGGRLAGSDVLISDTPVGTIRASGLGMLSFAALTFSLLNDAWAAEPNVTFLDDDNINYKDLHHGIFELVTKEANPRHIIVDDPGQTIILTARGSSVSVSQVTNSPAHMEELRDAQQEALANLEKGSGSKGSSTPAYQGSPLLQPINFIAPDPSQAPNQLAPLQVVPPEFIVTFNPPPPTPPKLTFGAAPSLTLSATHLTATQLDDNIAGSAPNVALTTISGDFSVKFASPQDAAGATVSYALTIAGGNGMASGVIDSHTGLADVLVLNSNTVEGRVGSAGGTLAFTITLDPASGYVTFTEYRAAMAPPGTNTDDNEAVSLATGIVTLIATVIKDGLSQDVTLDLGSRLTFIEDDPSISTSGTAPSLTLSEMHLTATPLDDNIAGSAPDAALTTTSADFSTAFHSVQGADGATVSYALTIAGGSGTASGLIDSHTGLADILVLNGNSIEGHVGTTTGTLAFTIALDPLTGQVTFTEYRAVKQPLGTSPDSGEAVALNAGLISLVATITDKDADFRSASIDLGKQLTITDDGPSIKASGTAPSLSLSESHLTATALDDHIAGTAPDAALTTTSADFSTAFTSVQGADGATVRYALTIAGGNGTPSGLIDSHTGCTDVLVLNGNTIEGHVGTANGTLAFTITLDPATGYVNFTEYRAVEEPICTNPDAESLSFAAGIIGLTATITDKDGDFQSASIDLGKQLSITEDSPTIGGFPVTVIAAHDDQAVAGTYDVNFGADGEGAMHVAIHDGEVGSTGYDLATSNLGEGVTSVHVTGHGDDYTFYYSTHAAGGGVELDAYRTDSGGALCDPLFALLINPDGTYCFNFEKVEQLKDVTVTGSDFGASDGGSPQLTAPDAQLVVTGADCAGHPIDVTASSDGIAVGDDGQQIDPTERLNLAFTEKQSQVDFTLAHWQDCGTATLTFKVLDGSTCVHDFSICVPKPASGCAGIVVQETNNTSLINTYTFDNATQTYTLYVGKAFNQVQIDYDRAESGHPTFTVNNITYDEKTSIPSTDLLFDVSAVDNDGHSATTGLQVDIQGATHALPFAPGPESDALAGGNIVPDHVQHDLII